jgi:hypothetical protein
MSESKPEFVIPSGEVQINIYRPPDPVTELLVRVTALEQRLARMERELLKPESDR